MKKYSKEDTNPNWTKYKIVVPTEEDRKELMEAFEHIHYADVNSDFIAVNQLIHEYLCEEVTGDPRSKNNIIVDKDLYDKIQ